MKGTTTFSEDEEQTFEPIKPGIYRIAVVDTKDTKSKAGNDMVNIEYEITEGEYKGRKLWDNLLPEGKGNFRMKLFLKAVNQPHKGTIAYDTADWIGKELKVSVYNKVYNEKNQTKINEYIGESIEPEIPF